MAGKCWDGADYLKLAKLIAGENKEELDVVKEEVHLQAVAVCHVTCHVQCRRRTAHIACARKDSGSHKGPTHGGLNKSESRFQYCLTRATWRATAAAVPSARWRRQVSGELRTTARGAAAPDESAQAEEFARQEGGGLELLEVERVQRPCGGACQRGDDARDAQGTY